MEESTTPTGPGTPPGLIDGHTVVRSAGMVPPGPTGPPPAPSREPDQPRRFMTATDFLDRRAEQPEEGPARWGWRGLLRRATGGAISLRMGRAERAHVRDRVAIQRDFDGPRTIAFINPKGGAAKTTGVLMAGFTFGTVHLLDGVSIVPVLVGLFGLGELLHLSGTKIIRPRAPKLRELLPTGEEARRSVSPIARGTVIGSLIGVIPGVTSTISSLIAYSTEKKVSKHRDEIGTGAIEGVAAPETANNAHGSAANATSAGSDGPATIGDDAPNSCSATATASVTISTKPVHSTGAIALRCGADASRRLAHSCTASHTISTAATSCATVAKTCAPSGLSVSAHAFLGALSSPLMSPPSRKNGTCTASAVR